MSIKFEPLVIGGDAVGEAAVRFGALKIRALDINLVAMLDAPALRCTASGVITRRAVATLRKPPLVVYAGRPDVARVKLPTPRAYARDLSIDVELDLAFVNMPSMQVATTGIIRRRGSADTSIPLARVFASDASNLGAAVLPRPRLLIYDLPPVERFAAIFQTPGYLYGIAGEGMAGIVSAASEASASDSASSYLTIQARDSARVVAALQTHLVGTSSAVGAATVIDRGDPIVWLIAEASAATQDDPAAFIDMLLTAVEIALLTGAAESRLDAFIAVAAVADAHDRADPVIFVNAETGVEAVDEGVLQRVSLLVHAMAAAFAEAEATGTLRMLVVATDAAAVTAEVGSSLEALAAAFDSGHVMASIRIGDTAYAIYAMTVEGQIMSEYADVTFNSQALHDGHLYAASENGIFLMEGDDDAGEPINASVRVGLTALGTQALKKVPAVYVGYTSDGSMLCKVSTTHNRVKKTNVYRLNPIPRGVVGDERFTPSKGLNSVYWDFELSNYEGTDFELDTVKVWRLVLSRRK